MDESISIKKDKWIQICIQYRSTILILSSCPQLPKISWSWITEAKATTCDNSFILSICIFWNFFFWVLFFSCNDPLFLPETLSCWHAECSLQESIIIDKKKEYPFFLMVPFVLLLLILLFFKKNSLIFKFWTDLNFWGQHAYWPSAATFCTAKNATSFHFNFHVVATYAFFLLLPQFHYLIIYLFTATPFFQVTFAFIHSSMHACNCAINNAPILHCKSWTCHDLVGIDTNQSACTH